MVAEQPSFYIPVRLQVFAQSPPHVCMCLHAHIHIYMYCLHTRWVLHAAVYPNRTSKRFGNSQHPSTYARMLQILTYMHANHTPRRILPCAEPLMSPWAILDSHKNCSSQASALRRFTSICKVLEREKEKTLCINVNCWSISWSSGSNMLTRSSD